MTVRLPNFDDVRAAAARIAPYAVKTPLLQHPALDARTGGRILLKAENLQRVGAFKFRGAYNAVSQIDRKAYPGGVVACSSGNHAQGVAAAATLCGRASGPRSVRTTRPTGDHRRGSVGPNAASVALSPGAVSWGVGSISPFRCMLPLGAIDVLR